MYKASSNHQISLGCEFNKEWCTQICNDRYQCCDSRHDLHQCCILYNICKVIDNCTGLNYEPAEEPYNVQCKKFPRFVVEQAGNVCFQAYFFLLNSYTFFCIKETEKEYKTADHAEDHHNDTESKCLVSISEFIYQCQGKCTYHCRSNRGKEGSA